jgi:ribose transport system substrate-binding protein
MPRFGQCIAIVTIAFVTAHGAARAETIAMFTKSFSNPIFSAMRTGAVSAGKALGVQVVNYAPAVADNVKEQLLLVDDAIKDKVDAIVFVPVDYTAVGPGVEKINAAGVPLINVNEKLSGGTVVGFVGIDDYELAKVTGRYLLMAMGGKGNLVVLNGPTTNLTAQARARGFADVVKEFPDVKVVATTVANYSKPVATKATNNALSSNAQVGGVLAANDPMAIGAVDALKAANRNALVAGINASREVMDLLKSGAVIGSGNYDSFTQGCLGVELAVRSIRKEATPKEVLLKPEVIDKSNLAPFDVPPDKRECPTLASVAGK